MEKKNSPLISLVRIARPMEMLAGLFTYSLGLGIVNYLGKSINWPNAFLGSSLVIFFLLVKNFLSAYYAHPESIPAPVLGKRALDDEPDFVELKEVEKPHLMQIGLIALAFGAAITVLLMVKNAINYSELLALGLSLLLVYVLVVPPLRLEKKGYGELFEALLIANLFPMQAFLLQAAELHTLILMTTLPLTFLFMSMKIAVSLEYFAYDMKHGAGSLIVKMGWQQGMTLHNLSILAAFLLVGGFVLLKMPWSLAWPFFLALPLGLLQIIQIQRIGDGNKPFWLLLRINAWATFLVAVYLFTITLWIR
jgi:1,4-dihydroxy-2-naphthoate octaprenyltransferase